VAADGARGVGVAWRPLTDADYTDVGSAMQPPTTPADAEVRWTTVEPGAEPSPVRRHATTAQPLGGVSGIGPWPLSGNGMKAARLGDRAVFVWLDGDAVMGARAPDETPVELAPTERAPLIALRGEPDALELLLFDSSPRVRAFSVTCE
jgi:hypothetical protein